MSRNFFDGLYDDLFGSGTGNPAGGRSEASVLLESILNTNAGIDRRGTAGDAPGKKPGAGADPGKKPGAGSGADADFGKKPGAGSGTNMGSGRKTSEITGEKARQDASAGPEDALPEIPDVKDLPDILSSEEILEKLTSRIDSAGKNQRETEEMLSKLDSMTGAIVRANAAAGGDLRKTGGREDGTETLPAAGGASDGASSGEPKEDAEPEKDPMEELDELIGLETIKKDVKELTDFVRIQKLRKGEGLKSVPVSLHLVFTGNPGTGKTTVARIIGKIYRKIGVLEKGQLVEVDRAGLVAGYVGQTAIKTQGVIDQAMGGVLFIDEAYSLSQKDDAFGQEAVDTILKAMEDHRDQFVVIVAGYTKPMEKFIGSNPGLKSRFNKYIEFPDYTVDELEQIFYMNCRKYDYTVEEDAKKHIREMISAKKLSERENFANAREVRNLFEKIITNQARRVVKLAHPTHEDMMTITMDDLDELMDGADAGAGKEPEKKEPEKKEPEKKEPEKKEPEKAGADAREDSTR